jgi:hypothetical protein
MSNPEDLYPKTKHAIIKYTALVLNKPQAHITYQDVEKFKEVISHEINNSNLSPNQIAHKFSIQHTNFAMFIKNCLKIQLKDVRTAVRNTKLQMGKTITDGKKLYHKECQFRFNPYSEPRILNFELTKSHKWYHPVTNKNGITRDHMLSICDGWRNNIPAEIISHPANCHLLLATDNFKKNAGSSITYDQLLERIEKWDHDNGHQSIVLCPKRKEMTDEHRSNISKANLGVRIFTNGEENIRVAQNEIPPVGYRQGLTRIKNKSSCLLLGYAGK